MSKNLFRFDSSTTSLSPLLVDSQYFPCIDYIKELVFYSYINIAVWAPFKKGSFVNRCTISGSNNPIQLTIPIKGGREQKALVKNVEVDKTGDWQKRHIKSVQSAYAKAPFYEYYISDLVSLVESEETSLLVRNLDALKWVFRVLKINVEINLMEETDELCKDCRDLRGYFSPRTQQSPPLDNPIRYQQVFQDKLGFQPNLSIVDLLFCEGPNARNLLQIRS